MAHKTNRDPSTEQPATTHDRSEFERVPEVLNSMDMLSRVERMERDGTAEALRKVGKEALMDALEARLRKAK